MKTVLFAVLLAALLPPMAVPAQEIGFAETFALADHREEALKELVPGTDDYFYYHALHYQNTAQREAYRDIMDAWVRQHRGTVVARARELMNRQALLDYGREPAQTLEYLKRELRLHFPHAQKTGERRGNAPTRFDNAAVSAEALLARALAERKHLERIENEGLGLVAGADLTDDQRRNLLSRLERPDYPDLAGLVAADLRYRDSRGFGHHAIHAAMTRDQLDALLLKVPALRNQSAFVTAYLGKLVPPDEVDLASDPEEREAYYDRAWAFVGPLDPVHNSLKANVLYNRLRHDRGRGVYDEARFRAYLQLPRNVPYLREELRRAIRSGEHLAQLNRDFGLVMLPPVRDEEPLVRELLLHHLRDAENYDAYRPWVRDEYLKPLFAETKIVHGIGEPAQWAALLPPEAYRALKERVDLDFAADNPERLAPADPVQLGVFVKNVPKLIVKIFEINTFNYYRETGRPLDLAVNLDGLVASWERRLEFTDTPERRVLRTFDFPELEGRGVYVIELIGNGRSSRALVQKGRLGLLQELTPAGHAFTVLDEANRRVPDARIWLGGREFEPGGDGRITVPFSTDPGPASLIVRAGGFASLTRFRHEAETYELEAGLYVDREELLRRGRARVAVRPVLRVAGQPASLRLLEDVRLVLRSVDGEGVATEKEVAGFAVQTERESVYEFAVPDNLAALTVTLLARVENVTVNAKQDLADSETFTVNGIDRTAAVQDLHVSRTAEGYVLELRGKNGEPRPGEPVAAWFKHRMFRDEVYANLQTDEGGRCALGPLDGVDRFRARDPMGTEHTWFTARDAYAYPAELHGRAGGVLAVPVTFPSDDPAADCSLLETRGGTFVRDRHDALAAAGGFLELRNLPAGDYSLFIRPHGREIAVRLTGGEERDGFALSARRALQQPRLEPVQVVAVETTEEDLVVRLAHATPFTRVHVFATRYLPAHDVFALLDVGTAPPLLAQAWQPARTFYESGRAIGDEYRYVLERQLAAKFPGNMLERPGLLLNPWAVRDTEAAPEVLGGGGVYRSRSQGAAEAHRARRAAADGRAAGAAGGYAGLDFLARPAAVLLGAVPGADGTVRVPRAALHGKPHVRLFVADPTASLLRDVALPDTPVATRELRLADGLDPAKGYAEQKLVTPLQAGESLVVADVTTSAFQVYDTLAAAYRLLATLRPDATLDEFGFLLRWPGMEPGERRELYSKYACHELNFFLYHKDRAFFDGAVLPYLRNKKDKTFLDHWLLGDDLAGYLEPWRFGRLNAVERILLGRRIPEQTASVVRDAAERADLIPPDIEAFNRRFDTALRAGAFGAEGETARALDEIRRKAGEQKAEHLAAFAPGAAPADALPETAARALRDRAAPAAAAPAPPARQDAKAKRLDGDGEAAPVTESEDFFEYDEAGKRREATRRFFRKLESTKEWAENNYYHLPAAQQGAGLVAVNAFWADYAAHDGRTPFLSGHFPMATGTFTEMMLALAVLDVPFETAPPEERIEGVRYERNAATPSVVFHEEIREAERVDEPSPVLVSQHFFRADDRYRFENNERYEKYVSGEFLTHVVYGGRVILTNPTGNRQKLQLLLQLPAGALPVNNGFYTRGVYVVVEPYSTQTAEYTFYFPATGRYPHYPVTVARNAEVVAAAAPFVFNVVDRLSEVDRTSWAWVSQFGAPDEVLAFLDAANIHRLDLEEIAWRMKDKDFFGKALARLEARHVYHDTLWSYGLYHDAPAATREFLRHAPFADRCGLVLDAPLLALDPVERLDFEHLEYAPLVNPRAHALGAKRKILNDRFREQYQRFMAVLAYRPSLRDVDELAVCYYMALQDRVGEALAWFERVDRAQVPEQLQADYLQGYLAFYRGDRAEARRIAQRHAEDAVDRWRNRFAQVLAQLDEIEKGEAALVDERSRDQVQDRLAATEPALEVSVEAGKIRLDYRHLAACTLNFYPMDIELLFSGSPFLQEDTSQFSFIRPVLTRAVALPPGGDQLALDLPAAFRTKNVMVEAVAGGLRKAQAYYANTLRVQVIETYGQVQVSRADTRKPLPGVYVKVYARMNGGGVKFFKDGYTDLRGRFDYVSLNTSELNDVERFAILVLSENCGAVVREAVPPRR